MARLNDPAKRSAILEAARTVFKDKGYTEARMSEIAARAGVAVGTVYLYFESKEDVFRALKELQGPILAWRVFPYVPSAALGHRFSASYISKEQGAGRFDIPDRTPVLYLAESPVHAVVEILQGFRNQTLDQFDLTRFGNPLALASVTLRIPTREKYLALLDLCDPDVLRTYDIRPDALASLNVEQTQAIARRLFEEPCVGFRWWSALSGDWHSSVVFQSKLERNTLRFGTPEVLTIQSEVVVEAARRLSIRLAP